MLPPFQRLARVQHFLLCLTCCATAAAPNGAGYLNWYDLRWAGEGAGLEGALRARAAAVRPGDPQNLQYTSGTTGEYAVVVFGPLGCCQPRLLVGHQGLRCEGCRQRQGLTAALSLLRRPVCLLLQLSLPLCPAFAGGPLV